MVGARRMELIASDKKRELTFRGRVKGMKKKAYELSTLCGLDIGMIICSPSGQIETLSWPNQDDNDGKTLLDLIASYKNQDGKRKKTVNVTRISKKEIQKVACESELYVKSEKELRESVMYLDSKIERVKERIQHLKKEKQPQATDASFIQDYEIMDPDDLVFLLNNIIDQPVTPIHEDFGTAWPHDLPSLVQPPAATFASNNDTKDFGTAWPHDLPSLVQPTAATFASNNDTNCHSNILSVMTMGGYPMSSQVMIGHAAFQDFTYNSNLHDESQYTNDNGDQLSYNPYPWRTPY